MRDRLCLRVPNQRTGRDDGSQFLKKSKFIRGAGAGVEWTVDFTVSERI